MHNPHRVLICGTGSASHVMAALLGSPGIHDISLLSLSQRGEQFRLAMGDMGVGCSLPSSPERSDIIGQPHVVNPQDISALVPKMDVIFMAMPAFGHESYLQKILPYVVPKTVFVLMPAYGCADLLVQQQLRELSRAVPQDLQLLLLEQLPWVCRTVQFGRAVKLLAHKREINCVAVGFDGLANFIAPDPDLIVDTLALLQSICQGDLRYVSSGDPRAALALSIFSPNAIMHASLMFGFYQCSDSMGFGREQFTTCPRFYQDFSSESVQIMAALSDEVLEVKRCLLERLPSLAQVLAPIRSVHVWMQGAYKDSIQDPSTLESCLRTNRVTRTLLHPMLPHGQGGYRPDFQHRYITEDIPYGLLPLKGFSTLLGITTPTLDQIIGWAQNILGTTWLDASNLTEAAKKVPVRTPQRFGINHISAFSRDPDNESGF